jgi:hypothetical protein
MLYIGFPMKLKDVYYFLRREDFLKYQYFTLTAFTNIYNLDLYIINNDNCILGYKLDKYDIINITDYFDLINLIKNKMIDSLKKMQARMSVCKIITSSGNIKILDNPEPFIIDDNYLKNLI